MRGLLLIAPIALGLLSVALAAEPPTPARLSADMLLLARKAQPGRTVAAAPDDPFKLIVAKRGGDEEFTIVLDRVWGYCQQASRDECRKFEKEFIAKILAPRGDLSLAKLRFIVRDSQYVTAVRNIPTAKPDQQPAFIRQIGDDLFMLLAADSKEAIALVNTGTLDELGIDEDDAWNLAIVQTRSILPRLPEPAAVTKTWQGYQAAEYLGSMLGPKDDWADLAAKVGPDLFVTAVSDRLVLVGKISPGKELDKLAEAAAQDCAAQERCISPHVYRFQEGRWVVAK